MSQRSPLEKRRDELVALSNLQRDAFIMQAHVLRASLSPTGIGNSLLEAAKQNKWLLIGGTLALTFIKPKRLLAGLEMGLVGWGMWKQVVPLLEKVRGHFARD